MRKDKLNFKKRRMIFINMKAILGFLLFLSALTPLHASTVVVYHTSDVHGGYSAEKAKWDKENPDRLIGGFAALSSLVGKETAPYLLIDSGDTFQGTAAGNFSKGMASVELMNRLGYVALVPGNHDFDYGIPVLRDMAVKANFPLLGANMYDKTSCRQVKAKNGKKESEKCERVGFVEPFTVVKRGGHRIVILGIAGTHTATSTLPSNVKDIKFGSEPKETEKWVKKIEKEVKPTSY